MTWTNQDTAPHDVLTASAPVTVDSPMLEQGDQWSYTFTTPGTYDYYCTVHPDMTARIVVEPAPEPAAPAQPDDHGDHGSGAGEEPAPESVAPGPETEPEPDSETEPATEPTEEHAEEHPEEDEATPHDHDDAAAETPAPSPTGPTEVAVEPAATEERLDPLLLVAGAVAGVAVTCLLLVGSRTATARTAPTAEPPADNA